MFNAIVIWFLKSVLKERVVMVVYEGGSQKIRPVVSTEGGKVYVRSEGNKVGFLDQPKNKAGEFRKGISDDKLIRWFDV
jgi:hypothetical protein